MHNNYVYTNCVKFLYFNHASINSLKIMETHANLESFANLKDTDSVDSAICVSRKSITRGADDLRKPSSFLTNTSDSQHEDIVALAHHEDIVALAHHEYVRNNHHKILDNLFKEKERLDEQLLQHKRKIDSLKEVLGKCRCSAVDRSLLSSYPISDGDNQKAVEEDGIVVDATGEDNHAELVNDNDFLSHQMHDVAAFDNSSDDKAVIVGNANVDDYDDKVQVAITVDASLEDDHLCLPVATENVAAFDNSADDNTEIVGNVDDNEIDDEVQVNVTVDASVEDDHLCHQVPVATETVDGVRFKLHDRSQEQSTFCCCNSEEIAQLKHKYNIEKFLNDLNQNSSYRLSQNRTNLFWNLHDLNQIKIGKLEKEIEELKLELKAAGSLVVNPSIVGEIHNKIAYNNKKTVTILHKFYNLLSTKAECVEDMLIKRKKKSARHQGKRCKEEELLINDFKVMLQSLTSIIDCFEQILS